MFVMLKHNQRLVDSNKGSDPKGIISSKELEPSLDTSLQQVFQLSPFRTLKNSGNEREINEALKSGIMNELEKGILENIRANFIKGNYDGIAFNENPLLTTELNALGLNYPRDFIQTLFVRCKSKHILQFWLDEVKVPLPEDTLALAVNLGNNVVVLQYLKSKGWFDELSKEDREGLLARAKRFEEQPGFEYLEEEFKIKGPSF